MKQAENKGNIMAVDDNPANLRLLEGMLRQQGYQVRSFPRGRLALAAAAENPPELILLDINMPEMTGYEVCERLKADEKLAPIPVVFLSALDETGDKVKAFRSGGVDYITKPFQLEEVQARVETHIELRRLQRALQLQNDNLGELVDLRTSELADANARLRVLDRTKSDFLNLISHEFRTPLNGLLGVGELLLEESCSGSDGDELRGLFQRSRQRILAILDDAMLLTQIEVDGGAFPLGPVCLGSILREASEHACGLAQSRQVSLQQVPSDPGFVLGNQDLLIKAMRALIEAAVKFSEAGETVRLACRPVEDSFEVTIESLGRTLPEPAIPKFFDIFTIGEAVTPGGDLGLGPAVAYRILSLFGGSVKIENQIPAGIRLTVVLRNSPSSNRSSLRYR
jgi:two-component system sensor histidine kinase/response regulator